jgi:hypothetical protein
MGQGAAFGPLSFLSVPATQQDILSVSQESLAMQVGTRDGSQPVDRPLQPYT